MINEEINNPLSSTPSISQGDLSPETLSEKLIPLLQERLAVGVIRQKVGEVVIRKEIETRLIEVQVPVRSEKLIVEQISPEYKLLAEVELQPLDSSNSGIEDALKNSLEFSSKPTVIEEVKTSGSKVYGTLATPQAAAKLLAEISKIPDHNCEKIQIEIVLKDSQHQQTYQAWFDSIHQDEQVSL